MENKKKINISYHQPIYDEKGHIFSIDMVRIDLKMQFHTLQKILDCLSFMFDSGYVHWNSFKICSYADNFTFDCADGNSFWLGVGFRSSSNVITENCCLEFNPNKVGTHNTFQKVFELLNTFCKYSSLVRYDLAVDIPFERSNVFLQKDRRKYRSVQVGFKTETEYLGARNSPGYVKLYNKTVESHLQAIVTRFEITLDLCSYDIFQLHMPVIRYVVDHQLCFDDDYTTQLNETELYVLEKILECPSDITRLGRKMRKKIECILSKYTQLLYIPHAVYAQILSQLQNYVKFDIVSLL